MTEAGKSLGKQATRTAGCHHWALSGLGGSQHGSAGATCPGPEFTCCRHLGSQLKNRDRPQLVASCIGRSRKSGLRTPFKLAWNALDCNVGSPKSYKVCSRPPGCMRSPLLHRSLRKVEPAGFSCNATWKGKNPKSLNNDWSLTGDPGSSGCSLGLDLLPHAPCNRALALMKQSAALLSAPGAHKTPRSHRSC